MAIVKCYDRKRDITYVYESECFFDTNQGKYRYKRHLIGRVNPETGETVPTGSRGGYRPKKENDVQEEWIPMKPGRKKKDPVSGTMETGKEVPDELSQAKAAIRQLQDQLARSQEQYLAIVKKYNKLVDDISRILPERIEI